MDRIIVRTKLFPSRCEGSLLTRDKLLDRLQAGRNNPLTLITGGGGYGKTILAILWRRRLAAQEHDVGWFGITPADNDLSQFVDYFAAAIDLAAPGVGREAITLYNHGSSNAVEMFIAALINDIQQYRRDIYITLDDYHHIKSPVIHNLLQELLAISPANFHLIIISRVKPPLSLERLLAYNRITEINFSDLRLSYEEASTFVAMQGLKIDAKRLLALYHRTDGWIIGLQLFCFSLAKKSEFDLKTALKFDGPTGFSQYLEAEVLSQLPTELVDLLVVASNCDKFNAQFSAFITQNDRAVDIIQQLEEENIFILSLDSDDGMQWYRLHPLMRASLAERLAQLPAAEIKTLDQRACKWFLDHDMVPEAVHHAIHSHEYAMAAELVGLCGRQMIREGQLKTLLSWNDQIPAVITKDTLAMQFPIIGALILCWRLNEASAQLQKLEDSGHSFDEKGRIELKMLQAHLCRSKDDTQGILQIVEGVDNFGDDNFLRGIANNLSSLAYCHAGEYAKARDLQLRLSPSEVDIHQAQRKVVGESMIGLSFAMQGDMLQAEPSYRKAFAAAIRLRGKQSELAAYAASLLSEVLYEVGLWDEARQLLSGLLDVIDHVATPDGMIRSYMTLCRIASQTKHVNEAKSYIEMLEDLGVNTGLDRLVVAALFEGVLLALQEENMTLVEEYLRRMEGIAVGYVDSERCAIAEISIFAELARLRYQFYLEQWDVVLDTAAILVPVVMKTGRHKLRIGIELLTVLALDELGQRNEALDKLAECLSSCKRLGLQRTILDEGEPILSLASELIHRVELAPALCSYIESLIEAVSFESEAHTSRQAAIEDHLIEPLSKRELDVLQQLPQASTNKKLALLLGISRNTVKWHLKNIFGKLGVVSRDEAVARARDLNLIEE